MTNKRFTAIILAINILFIAISVARFVCFNSQIIVDPGKAAPVQIPENSLWYIIPQILSLMVLGGLVWLLKFLGENVWIRGGLVVFMLCRIATLITIHLFGGQFLIDHELVLIILNYLDFFVAVYVFATLPLIRNAYLRAYFRWLVIFLLLSIVLPLVGEKLYDDLNMHWALLNREVIALLPFLVTPFLFIRALKVIRLNLV
ncbi:MAG: hypothetical protein JST19_07495 [Bacteroidetes bacterium]|nr:hypothetical protein [Bacteroidota bacterium]